MIVSLKDYSNLDQDFYELNPQARGYFKKELTNRELWICAFYAAPDSIYKNLLPTDRKEVISEEVIEDPTFKWDDYQDTLDKMINLTTSKAEKLLIHWETDFEERLLFLKNIKYDVETSLELLNLKETWSKNTHNLWKHLQTCIQDVRKEKEITISGDAELSASETGDI